MDKDTKILLMAVVIILVALVSFNLTDLTGKVTRSSTTTITVSPSVVTFDKYEVAKMVIVRVLPGKDGISKQIELYKIKPGSMDMKVTSESADVCTDSACYNDVTLSYRVDPSLKPGRYYFVARDRRSSTIVGKSNILEVK